MAEYWIDPQNGNDAALGTSELVPWKTIPGMTGANAVAAGDTINVKADSWVQGSLSLTGNNLNYRVYGLGKNVLKIKVPLFVGTKPIYFEQKIVREAGVHEGYWTLDGSTVTTAGTLNYSTRTGCVIADINLVNSINNASAVAIGTSGQAQETATLRRFRIENCVKAITNFRPNTLLEYGLIKDVKDDGLSISTGATQSFHAGKYNTVQYVNFINPGYDTVSDIGDAIQLNSSTGYQGKLTVQYCYFNKPSAVKQGIMAAAIAGTLVYNNNYFDGVETGTVQLGLTDIQATARIYIRNNYWTQRSTNSNPIIRIAGGAIVNGSLTYIENNYVDIPNHAGLFSWGSDDAEPDGIVYIRNNTVNGIAYNGLSWSANIGLQTAGTIGVNAVAYVDNNIFKGASPVAIRLPTGGINDSRWIIRNNIVDGAIAFAAVGTLTTQTTYTKTAFQAAHSAATNNKEEAVTQISTTAAGLFLGYKCDINGKQFWNPPSMGAIEYDRPRVART